MGEVYRARDTSLNRDVAIKVLPPGVASDPDRLARFRREAEVLASLNHPNIAHVYGVESSRAGPALVMEFVDGRTLDETIGGRRMPLDDALPIARQIADALDAAHERAIVHRDLKPANVKITDGGVVKVLDFGLAKAVGPETTTGSNPAASPTITARATQLGVILGTAAYMAPEQAKGRPVDRRADIWAFGAVLFEMLAGRRAFGGDDVTEVMAAVIRSEPDWHALPADTPPAVRRLLRRCLEKDPKRRLRDIAEGMLQLDEGLGGSTPALPPRGAGTSPWGRFPALVVAAVLGAVAASPFLRFRSPDAEQARPVARVPMSVPDLMVGRATRNDIAISRDGRVVVYTARGDTGGATRLVRRPLASLEASPIRGTDDASSPFLSPDGQWVGFVDARDPNLNAVYRVPIHGGPRQLVAQVQTRIVGADWGRDNTIILGSPAGLFKVTLGEQVATPLTSRDDKDGQVGHGWPSIVSPGGLVLFSIGRGSSLEDSSIAAVSLATREVTQLGIQGTSPRYLPTGHVAYLTGDGTLWTAPFDPNTRQVGTALPAEQQVVVKTGSGRNFDVAESGTLVYVRGEMDSRPMSTLVWVEGRGKTTPIAAEPHRYIYPRVSPDGARAAVEVHDGRDRDIYVLDLVRESLARLTHEPTHDSYPVWMPDSTRVVYNTIGTPPNVVLRRNADGTGQLERLYTLEQGGMSAYAIPPAGDALVLRLNRGLGRLTLDRSRDLHALLEAREYSYSEAVLSRDGGWISYQVSGSSGPEVFVSPFPDVDRKRVKISGPGGGRHPLWSPKADAIYYVRLDGWLMRVPVRTVPDFVPQVAEPIFDASEFVGFAEDLARGPEGYFGRTYDVSPLDGRFLMVRGVSRPSTQEPQLLFVFDWLDDIRQRRQPR
jgi:serine/threonine-protein kinase